jgi:hypothetical protein
VIPRPIADGWYAWTLPGVDSFGDWLTARPCAVRAAAGRIGAARGIALYAASLRRPAVVVVRTDPGWRTLLLLRALLGRRRKLVVLQFIRHPIPGRLWPAIDRWAVRRALKVGQALTAWEREEHSRYYGLPGERFVHVPWPARLEPAGDPPSASTGSPRVLSAGRAGCDWETLFAAARDRDWPLTVICSAEDLPAVRALAAGTSAEVRAEVPLAEYRQLLASSGLSLIVTGETGISHGHIRLMEANEAGVPVIATGTRGLDGYLVDGETALVVPPGDALALRSAVERLLADPAERERLRRRAFACSQRWTGQDYLNALAHLV